MVSRLSLRPEFIPQAVEAQRAAVVLAEAVQEHHVRLVGIVRPRAPAMMTADLPPQLVVGVL